MKPKVEISNALRNDWPIEIDARINRATFQEWIWDALESNPHIKEEERQEDMEYVLDSVQEAMKELDSVLIPCYTWLGRLVVGLFSLPGEAWKEHAQTIACICHLIQTLRARVEGYGKRTGDKDG